MNPRADKTVKLLRGAAWLIAALPTPAPAQTNLGFESGEAGWSSRGSEAAFDFSSPVARSGAHGLALRHEGGERVDRLEQTLPAASVGGDRLRIEAWLKTALDDDGVVSLWVRVDGDAGLLYVDRAVEAGARGTEDWTRYRIEAPLARDARSVRFGIEFRGAGSAWVDDFGVTPAMASELPALSAERLRYVQRGLDLIEANASRRDEIDWAAWRADVLAQARGDDEVATAQLALRYGLTALGDGHSYLMTAAQMARLAAAPAANARRGGTPEPPRAAKLDAATAYLAVPGFAGGTQLDQVAFAERLQAELAAFDREGACRFVLDLRGNRGGNLWPMLAGVGPLLADGDVATALYPDGRRSTVWYRDGKAGLADAVQLRVRGEPQRLQGTPTIAVLTDETTASAAEMLVIGLRNAPTTKVFGTPTSGATSGTRIFELGDGAAIVLAVATTLDAHGRAYLGPIQPDERIDDDSQALPLERQAVVAAALRWLGTAPPCATPVG